MSDTPTEAGKKQEKHARVVGIGASAGGLEALTHFFAALSPETGMAFVVIQHLSPDHDAFLSKALADVTPMKVTQLEETMAIEPNHVYVIAPGTEIIIQDSHLCARPRPSDKNLLHHPIDVFFCSLAEHRDSQAIGIVVSGTATDGTRGLQVIQSVGGVTMVQDPQEAKFSGMPRSATETLAVDHVLPVAQLANKLAELRPQRPPSSEEKDSHVSEEEALDPVFAALKSFTGRTLLDTKPRPSCAALPGGWRCVKSGIKESISSYFVAMRKKRSYYSKSC